MKYLFILLAAQPGKLVSNNNIKLSGSLDDFLPLLRGHVVRNLGTVDPDLGTKKTHVINQTHLT